MLSSPPCRFIHGEGGENSDVRCFEAIHCNFPRNLAGRAFEPIIRQPQSEGLLHHWDEYLGNISTAVKQQFMIALKLLMRKYFP